MLLQLSIANYLSFKDEITLNLIPAKSRIMKEHELCDDRGKSVRALPIATVYGANGSGKSNLVKAIAFAQKLIAQGTRPDMSTGVTPHLLDAESAEAPSRFEFVFKHDGVLYTYGFCISKTTVHEEWLFARYTSQESQVFERITKDGKAVVEAGPKLVADVGSAQFIEFVAKGTRANQLFLTEANEKNIDLIKPVLHWFGDHLQVIWPGSKYGPLAYRSATDNDFLDYISNFLRITGTGVDGLHCESEPFDPDRHLEALPEEVRKEVLGKLNTESVKNMLIEAGTQTIALSKGKTDGVEGITYRKLKAAHHRTDGQPVHFELAAESDGTRRILDLAPALPDVWEHDRVFIVDELDRSLHTHLSRLFLETVLAGITEKGARGQFIMTTHDTNLLDRELLRRDEIWFMEKDDEGSSHLTSLAEYKVSDGLNYENGYLNGRFGAIPFFGNHRELLK